jgi:hypothetical protein
LVSILAGIIYGMLVLVLRTKSLNAAIWAYTCPLPSIWLVSWPAKMIGSGEAAAWIVRNFDTLRIQQDNF